MGSRAYISVLDNEKLEQFMNFKGLKVFNLIKEGATLAQIEKDFLHIYILFDKENLIRMLAFLLKCSLQ